MQTATKPKTETIGRIYNTVRFGVHNRKIGTEGWYGVSNYKTLEEARAAIKGHGTRYHNLGGLVIDVGDAKDVYEYRIVRVESVNEVVEAFFKKL